MDVGIRNLINFYDSLRYSLVPLERVLYPFKKYRFNNIKRKCLILNGINANLLQDIDNYGMLAKIFFDLQVSTDASYGKFNVLAGTRNDTYLNLANITTADAAASAAVLKLGDMMPGKV